MNVLYGSALYRETHVGNPLINYSRNDKVRFERVVDLGLALCEEYRLRYGRTHGALSMLYLLKTKVKFVKTNFSPLYTQPQVMPDEYKIDESTVAAYRVFYVMDKRRFATWRNRPPPHWYQALVEMVDKGASLDEVKERALNDFTEGESELDRRD
jgi:hypothetical protein